METSGISFGQEFNEHLLHVQTNNRFDLSEYFVHSYRRDYALCKELPHVLCSRSVSVSSPFCYEMEDLDAFCMIRTTKGTGKLDYEGKSYELSIDTLAFFDCRKFHRLTCLHNLWEYSILFLSRKATSYYYSRICTEGCCFKLTPYTSFPIYWTQLFQDQTDDEEHALLRSRTLILLYTEAYLLKSSLKSTGFHIPTYLLAMKKSFDTDYAQPFSLDELSARYHVSKYRLCREFAQYFQETPLQYLNQVRIEEAKKLLLATDEKICTVGQMVGIENTNHFIRLFKEKTGVTPLHFRRETPVL